MDKLEKSRQLFQQFLKETPKEELDRLAAKYNKKPMKEITIESVAQDCADHINNGKTMDWIVNCPVFRYIPQDANIGRFEPYIDHSNKYKPEYIQTYLKALQSHAENVQRYLAFISLNDWEMLEKHINITVRQGIIKFMIEYYNIDQLTDEAKAVIRHQIDSEYFSLQELNHKFEQYTLLFKHNQNKK